MLFGVWKVTKIEVVSGVDEKTIIETDEMTDECENKETTIFKKNDLATTTYFDEDENGECKQEGVREFNYFYNKEAKTLKLVDGKKKETLKVDELTSMFMIIEGEYLIDENEDGYKDMTRTYLKKQ